MDNELKPMLDGIFETDPSPANRMRAVDIIGAGMFSFGKHENTPLMEMGVRAAIAAIKDAGIKPAPWSFRSMELPGDEAEMGI